MRLPHTEVQGGSIPLPATGCHREGILPMNGPSRRNLVRPPGNGLMLPGVAGMPQPQQQLNIRVEIPDTMIDKIAERVIARLREEGALAPKVNGEPVGQDEQA